MITDQNNNGIPSATRMRTQLVKPVQTMNSGSTQKKNPLDPEAAAKVITSEKYNPILAKGSPDPLSAPSVSPRPATNGVKPTVDSTGYNSKYGYATGIYDKTTGEELFSNPDYFKDGAGDSIQATPSYQDLFRGATMDEFGNWLAGQPKEKQMAFFKNYADGVYERNGMQTTATMTGEPDQYNTVGTRIENLGNRK